jgi:hypothetical protein
MIAFRVMASATYLSSAIVGDAAWALWTTWIQQIDSGTSIKRFMMDLHLSTFATDHMERHVQADRARSLAGRD